MAESSRAGGAEAGRGHSEAVGGSEGAGVAMRLRISTPARSDKYGGVGFFGVAEGRGDVMHL